MNLQSRTIKCIEQINEDTPTEVQNGESTRSKVGYAIRLMDGKSVYLLISNDQDCCESWGYISPQDDNLSYYNGATIRNIDVVLSGEEHSGYDVVDAYDYTNDGGGVAFIRVHTDKGVLVLAVYNIHNGYYSHPVYLILPYGDTRKGNV